MKKNDWIGLGASIGLHAALLLLFTFLTAAKPDQEQLGFVEVEFGPFAQGRPVQEASTESPDAAEEEVQQPQEPAPEASAPEEAKPVDLPDEPDPIPDEDRVSTPETETISPEEQNNEAEVNKPEPEPDSRPIRPLGSGAVDGSTGSQSGSEGEGADEERSAPFEIEGLNRDAVYAPLPVYPERVNATIRVRITVDPQGRITRRFPLLKGNPALEQAAMDALQRWRFNPLPPNAPQEPQTGVVTFRFRLE